MRSVIRTLAKLRHLLINFFIKKAEQIMLDFEIRVQSANLLTTLEN